jgi:hypothetical protein
MSPELLRNCSAVSNSGLFVFASLGLLRDSSDAFQVPADRQENGRDSILIVLLLQEQWKLTFRVVGRRREQD